MYAHQQYNTNRTASEVLNDVGRALWEYEYCCPCTRCALELMRSGLVSSNAKESSSRHSFDNVSDSDDVAGVDLSRPEDPFAAIEVNLPADTGPVAQHALSLSLSLSVSFPFLFCAKYQNKKSHTLIYKIVSIFYTINF